MVPFEAVHELGDKPVFAPQCSGHVHDGLCCINGVTALLELAESLASTLGLCKGELV